MVRLLQRRGLLEEGNTDPLVVQEPLLVTITATSIQGQVAADRTRLESLCRYVNRPPLAAGRLQILDAKRVAFDLKMVWSDGTYRIELSPQELIEKLAALVPPRNPNVVRCHGILAPNASTA